MNDNTGIKLKPIPFWQTFLFFLFPTIGIIISLKILLPFFVSIGLKQNVSYIISMTCTLLPVLLTAIIAFNLEGNKFSLKLILDRFIIKPLTKKDWLWIFIGFFVISVFSGIFQFGIEYFCKLLNIKYYTIPPEFGFRKIQITEWWIFIIHFFYFICNILGEEFLYRGYLLPRQELKDGKLAWLINGILWFMTHLGVGLPVITMIPLLLVVPFVVQKQKNTSIGIIIHGLIAGMGFYLTAFGIVK
jgi:membrane protease YdiL (CAAX protease family)